MIRLAVLTETGDQSDGPVEGPHMIATFVSQTESRPFELWHKNVPGEAEVVVLGNPGAAGIAAATAIAVAAGYPTIVCRSYMPMARHEREFVFAGDDSLWESQFAAQGYAAWGKVLEVEGR